MWGDGLLILREEKACDIHLGDWGSSWTREVLCDGTLSVNRLWAYSLRMQNENAHNDCKMEICAKCSLCLKSLM